jgi:endonuclease/exonuclease/phosphatase family metal-dependent hydrolase
MTAGDFNQRIPRQRQPQEVADELALTLEGLVIHTSGETEQGALIDHIVTTDELLCGRHSTWSGESETEMLSDHAGVVVGLTIRPASESEPTFDPQTT